MKPKPCKQHQVSNFLEKLVKAFKEYRRLSGTSPLLDLFVWTTILTAFRDVAQILAVVVGLFKGDM